ncbi:hypothetical protein NQ317_019525 [Molorchus minor]|uniref:G kinase-anchoring protein 1 n=1 Tax=Molorchus minor TaxID=1323400 RepID=A0ABQ9J6J6_9CUCU|nr:hypothetical protein NQ317_019525 [Molorchus minor]
MDLAVPSRFACLKIEDDEFKSVSNKSTKRKQEKQIKKPTTSTTTAGGAAKKSAPKQNQPPINAPSKKRSKPKQDSKQWEDWKKKDDKFVNDNFEQDMESAIIQSKLDFENKKKNSVSVIVTTQDNKSKKKRTKTMSLDQFLENDNQSKPKEINGHKSSEEEGNYFESALVSAKEEIRRERVEEKRRERANNIEEVITLAQCQQKLETERVKNEQLRQELEEAKKEIGLVKKRNSTLCSMLSQGEMKDKAAVLLELERLTTVKEELTEEVTRLHKLLEQERSSTKSNANGITESRSESHSTKHKASFYSQYVSDINKKKKN